MKRYIAALAAFSLAATLLTACDDDSTGQPSETATPEEPSTAIDPADFQAQVDNPLFPLSPGATFVYEGEETDPDTGETIEIRIESTVLAVLAEPAVAGVEVTVVEVKDFEDGELVERTLDYYAQHTDGTVYYFGERVDDYEDGEVVGHEGQWLAGEGDNLPGIFMPADTQVGTEFEQERAPGVAEDRSKIVEVDQTVTTAAGTFSGCIKTEDFDPLGNVTEFKYYCTGVGLVREEPSGGGQVDLISY